MKKKKKENREKTCMCKRRSMELFVYESHERS
jgi:hypothetical protein